MIISQFLLLQLPAAKAPRPDRPVDPGLPELGNSVEKPRSLTDPEFSEKPRFGGKTHTGCHAGFLPPKSLGVQSFLSY